MGNNGNAGRPIGHELSSAVAFAVVENATEAGSF